MAQLTDTQLREAVSSSSLGRYEIVKMALNWILVNKYNEEFKKLPQTELINKTLNDVITGVATLEKIEELRKKIKEN
ncbi:MAG: hypothetical protein LBS29_01835 [Endomicrobium sp.]|uniref:hypothetical protein n=1 Tax=Candidatus Endomicrobiellum cubanum TaxID=3242325 RepID=UPI00281A5315|nr:hypothetical protein [Endomicrobium sp.]MDR2395912.1 hypothetical protein [Endomicrobium sp.]